MMPAPGYWLVTVILGRDQPVTPPATPWCARMSVVSDFLRGVHLLGRGAATLFGSRRLLVLGVVPALVTALLYAAVLVGLIAVLPDLTAALTPDAWSPGAQVVARVLAGIALLVAVAAVGVVAFVALTLVIGGPWYERLSEIVDDGLGAPPGPAGSRASSVLRGARDGAVLVAMSVALAVPLFVAGFVPVLGQTVVPVVAALVGGRLLVLELTGPALDRRGRSFAERRRLVRSRRALTWGLGVPATLLCAVPLLAIVVVPAAAIGATLLARELVAADTGPVATDAG